MWQRPFQKINYFNEKNKQYLHPKYERCLPYAMEWMRKMSYQYLLIYQKECKIYAFWLANADRIYHISID